MNIFKILASGDGSINEPNVSAFLGHILNPYADHGLRDEFLKRVLFKLYLKNKNTNLKDILVTRTESIRNFSTYSNFDIIVLLEQAFHNKTSKKEIVDIVILCYEKKVNKKESLAEIVLSNEQKNYRGDIKQIFLIENKIRDNATRKDQLFNQYNSSVERLIDLLKLDRKSIQLLLSFIFVSPLGEKSNKEFEDLLKKVDGNLTALHLLWSNKEDEDDSIQNETIADMLKEILKEESIGKIDSVNEYAKATIKSFIAFIENNFKSNLEEEIDGQTSRDIEYDFNEFKTKYENLFNKELWHWLEEFQNTIKKNYKNITIRHTQTHTISIFKNENSKLKKIFSLSRNGKQIKIELIYRSHHVDKSEQKAFINQLNKFFNIVIEMENNRIEIKSNLIDIKVALDLFDKQYRIINNYNH